MVFHTSLKRFQRASMRFLQARWGIGIHATLINHPRGMCCVPLILLGA